MGIMYAVIIALIVFACVVSGALIGSFLAAVVPPRHLSNEAKETVKLGMGLIATMTAILLGLLIASAKSFYDMQNTELTEMSSKVIFLDRVLAHYGPETKEARDLLRGAVTRALDAMERKRGSKNSEAPAQAGSAEILYDRIQELSPQNDFQRSLQNQALNVALDVAKTRWLMLQQATNSVSPPLLVVVVSWLTLIFCSFALLAPRTPIVAATLGLCALSVSAAIFLVVDMYSPFGGVIHLSSAALQTALAHIGK
jgi:hypothetical protein